MKPSNITHSHEYNDLPIMPSHAFHSEILQRLQERLTWSCKRHSQILVFLLVIQFPENYPRDGNNRIFSRWMADFIRHIGPFDPSYVWVREECPESPGRFHFHLLVFLNGNETQNPWGHLQTAQRCWAKTLGIADASGLISLCQPQSERSFQNSGFKLVRNSSDFSAKFNEAFCYLSYLAKTDSKSPIDGVRTFGCSTLN